MRRHFFLSLQEGTNWLVYYSPEKEIEKLDICFIAGNELLSFLKQAQSRRLSISIFCFCLTRRETGKVSLLLWCGSCSFGTPLYAHLFSLNHTCKQVGSAFFSYRFWIEFKTPGSSILLCWCTFKVVQHNSVELCRSKPACEFHALSMIFQTTSSTFQDSKI